MSDLGNGLDTTIENIDYTNPSEIAYGINIRIAREKKGWTQQELADNLGCAPGTVAGTETGRNSYAQVENLCDVLDLDVNEMRELRERQKAVTARIAREGRISRQVSRHQNARAWMGEDDQAQHTFPIMDVELRDDDRPRATIAGREEPPSMMDAAYLLAAINRLSPSKQKLVMNFITQLAEED